MRRPVAMHRHFYPRPPRGGRLESESEDKDANNFYPRPPRGGRLAQITPLTRELDISIHALREEGDTMRPR